MKEAFEKAMEKLHKAQIEANVIANKVLDDLPLNTCINTAKSGLYANSDIYTDYCVIYEIVKDLDGVYVVTEYDEYIDIHSLDDKLYNEVILFLLNNK